MGNSGVNIIFVRHYIWFFQGMLMENKIHTRGKMGRCTCPDLAKLFGCARRTIWKLFDEGLLPGARDYRGWRIITDKEKAIEVLESLFLRKCSEGE